jgi:hypothetical protein
VSASNDKNTKDNSLKEDEGQRTEGFPGKILWNKTIINAVGVFTVPTSKTTPTAFLSIP